MSTIVITGAGLADDIFTTDAAIFGAAISWNVTRLRAAADAGLFGVAERVPVAALPPMSSLADSNVDWAKVRWMIDNCSRGGLSGPLAEPAINVGVEIGDNLYRIPVDGNHRICAWRMLGHEFWTTYIVPPEVEGRFRVREFFR